MSLALFAFSAGYCVHPGSGIRFQTEDEKTLPESASVPEQGTAITSTRVITIEFNKPMESISIEGSAKIEGTFEWANSARTQLEVTPNGHWITNPLTIAIRGTDKTGKDMGVQLYSFPLDLSTLEVSRVNPAGNLMNISTIFTYQFSYGIDAESVELTGSIAREGEGQWNSDFTVLTISPAPAWSVTQHTIGISGTDLRGNEFTISSQTFTINTDVAVITEANTSGSVMSIYQPLVFNFDLEMDPSSVVVSGDFADDDFTITWSSGENSNDQLVFTPDTAWIDAGNRTFILDVNSLAGNPSSTKSLTYSILGTTAYVAVSGTASNSGTHNQPAANIGQAIASLAAFYDANVPKIIKVAGGTYDVSQDNATLPDNYVPDSNTAIYGGYNSANWGSRNIDTNTTMITDTSTSDNSVIFTLEDTKDSITIDGFTLTGADTTTREIISDRATFTTVKNNRLINPNSNPSSCYHSTLANVTFENNTVEGPCTIILDNYSRGTIASNILTNTQIFIGYSYAIITNNKISADTGTVYLSFSRGIVENNLIYSSTGRPVLLAYSCNFFCDSGQSTRIRNNTILYGDTVSASDGRGFEFFELTLAAYLPNIYVENNLIHKLTHFDNPECFKFENGTPTGGIGSVKNNSVSNCVQTAATFESYNSTDYTGNFDATPIFVDAAGEDGNYLTWDDNDWHLTAAAACSLREGGLDASALSIPSLLNTDLDGNPRTTGIEQTGASCGPGNDNAAGWSVGAYEFDP